MPHALSCGETMTTAAPPLLLPIQVPDDSPRTVTSRLARTDRGEDPRSCSADRSGPMSNDRELHRRQSDLLASTVRALVSAIEAKDAYTGGHSVRVARLAVRIALEMRCNASFVHAIFLAGLLHDIGKIGIDDSILRNTGRLTDQEFEQIKRHPELGYRILAALQPLAEALPAVLHHHERWDGRGYPLGLSGHDIPLMARILAVADAYDAMTSDRPYRAGMSDERVDEIFREGAGKHWDSEVVNAFFRVQEELTPEG